MVRERESGVCHAAGYTGGTRTIHIHTFMTKHGEEKRGLVTAHHRFQQIHSIAGIRKHTPDNDVLGFLTKDGKP